MHLTPVDMSGHRVAHKEPSSEVSYLTNMIQWLRMKKYQFEVMLPLYMLTPTEVIVFYVLSATFFFMFFAAAYFYLPNHISIISHRVYYYVMGEWNQMSSTVSSTASGLTQLVKKTSGVDVGYAAQTAASVVGHGKEL